MIATHGGRPFSIVSPTTATKAIASAIHCATRSRSFRTKTPSSTVNSGVMKYPSDVSTTRSWFTPQM